MYGAKHLQDAAALELAMRAAANAAGARVLLAESHISVHTWPELNFAALDIFMCGSADIEAAARALETALAPASCRVTRTARGQRNQASQPAL
jgi:S-adenosylmethionine decarboxylase